jgi:hypothetical protein
MALGVKGQSYQGMFQIVIGRTATMDGVSVSKEMGINTRASFGGTDEVAVVDGDFAMLENELQPLLHIMRKEGINIVAIHQHMSREPLEREAPQPRPRHYFPPTRPKPSSGTLTFSSDQRAPKVLIPSYIVRSMSAPCLRFRTTRYPARGRDVGADQGPSLT